MFNYFTHHSININILVLKFEFWIIQIRNKLFKREYTDLYNKKM